MTYPPFISNPDYCLRLFLPYKKRVDKKAKSILSIKAERKGGFANRSYQIRYQILIERLNGKKIEKAFWGLVSPDPTRFQSWKIMSYLWKRNFSSGNYSISEPIAYIKKHLMVITKEVKGESLFNILEKKSLPEIYSGLKKSANWLKKLHSTSPYSFKDIFSIYSKKYWQEQLKILIDGYPQKSEVLRKIIKEISFWEKNNERGPERVISHYDFQPKNIFLEKKKIFVLDFSESRLSKKVIDPFTLSVQLELMNNFLKKPFSLNKIKNFSEVFLKEYFGENWQKVLKEHQKDFQILRKKVAAQALVGSLILKRKPRIFSDILFG